MRKKVAIAIGLLALVTAWVLWLTKPPPTQAQMMGAVIDAVNRRQEIVSQGAPTQEIQEYLEQLFRTLEAHDFPSFRTLTHLKPNCKQLAILREVLFEGGDFCPATILEMRRTRDTEEDLTLLPFDWRSSSFVGDVRMYSHSRKVVRVHSEKRNRDYQLVLYDTTVGPTLLLAGELK